MTSTKPLDQLADDARHLGLQLKEARRRHEAELAHLRRLRRALPRIVGQETYHGEDDAAAILGLTVDQLRAEMADVRLGSTERTPEGERYWGVDLVEYRLRHRPEWFAPD